MLRQKMPIFFWPTKALFYPEHFEYWPASLRIYSALLELKVLFRGLVEFCVQSKLSVIGFTCSKTFSEFFRHFHEILYFYAHFCYFWT